MLGKPLVHIAPKRTVFTEGCVGVVWEAAKSVDRKRSVRKNLPTGYEAAGFKCSALLKDHRSFLVIFLPEDFLPSIVLTE